MGGAAHLPSMTDTPGVSVATVRCFLIGQCPISKAQAVVTPWCNDCISLASPEVWDPLPELLYCIRR
jgi:hypothetical protein